jgi:hypothetical protein
MMYIALFNIAGLAMIGWLLMIFLPTWSVTRKVAAWALFPVFLALLYAIGLAVYLVGSGLGVVGEFGSAEGVIRILATPGIALVAWIHILVFDHLVAVLIYRDNMRHRVVPVPVQSVILFLTLMFGPVGFLTYYFVRIGKRRSFFDDERIGAADGRSASHGHTADARSAAETAAPLVAEVPRPAGSLPVAFARTLAILWSHERTLAGVGALGVSIATLMAIAALVRGNAVPPEGNLLETATFDAAVGIFVLTLAALAPLAAFTPRGRRRWVVTFSTFVLTSYAIETVQAFRGLDPRFSAVAGPIDQAIGGVFFLIAQGVMICALIVVWKYFRPATAHLPHALRLAVRYGTFASVVAFGIGDVMSAVGGRSMGEAGNLLPLHAAGFHGLQAVPLVALLLVWANLPADRAARTTHMAGIAWLVACLAIALQTFGGRAVLDASALTAVAVLALVSWAVMAAWAVSRAASSHGRAQPATSRAPGAMVLLLASALTASACDEPASPQAGRTGTAEQRAALFDTILARTARRDAFSPVKDRALAFDPLEAMHALRDTVIEADTEEALFYALARLSHARRDRHLDVALVPDGLRPAETAGVEAWNGIEPVEPLQAPVRVFPDYGENGGYFIGDVASAADLAGGASPGDRIVAVHGLPVAEYEAAVRPYHRYSSIIGLRWKLAEAMTQRTAIFPAALQHDSLRLMVERADGSHADIQVAYMPANDITWRRVSEPTYPGFRRVRATPTWDLLLPDDTADRTMILVWYGFRETMVADVDTLVAMGQRDGLLDRPLIVDVTRSRGGSLGPYAIQRLQPRPFRTTFGNLRISDVIEPFVEEKRRDFAARNINDGGVPETVDDGGWLMDWLEHDVLAALARGDAYTNDVPFKSAHAPKDSDGILQPAPVHFRGPIAIISGPSGGSHLDQFNAIFVDNALGPVVGMTAGGYSNTWEWEETLTFPGTEQPVIGYMYDIGHTIRPNGEILEGNPAAVDEWIPLTAAGHADYYPRLLRAALARLGGWPEP